MKFYWILILILFTACSNNKYFIKSKKHFDNYYCFKQKRDDNLRVLIFTEGIPHYSYTRIYADENGNVTKIIFEKDSYKFYQAVTDFRNNQYFFNDLLVKHIDTFQTVDSIKRETGYEQTIKTLFNNKYCIDLKFPKIIGTVQIERPDDYLRHLEHRKLLKQKRKYKK